MDIDTNVCIALREIEELELMDNFPVDDEQTKKKFIDTWIKLYKEDITKILSQEDRSNDKMEAEMSSMKATFDNQMIALAIARKTKPKECARALRDRLETEKDYYTRLISGDGKFTVMGGKKDKKTKEEDEDLKLDMKISVDYMKDVMAHRTKLKNNVELKSPVMMFSDELEKARRLKLFDQSDLEKVVFGTLK